MKEALRAEIIENLNENLSTAEVTTVTVQLNEAGDTVFRSVVTERDRSRSRYGIATYRTAEVRERSDTVARASQDSISNSTTAVVGVNATIDKDGNITVGKEGFWTKVLRTLKWMVAVMCAGIGLVITIKVCWRKGW